MNYNHLFYFHVIAEEGSIVRASRRLKVSQPILSEQLKQIEGFFGVKFFDRRGGVLQLNANGQRALEFTRPMFENAERLLVAFDTAPEPAKFRMEIGVTVTAARSATTSRLTRLFRNPRTLVQVRQGDSHYLLHELVNSGLDIFGH